MRDVYGLIVLTFIFGLSSCRGTAIAPQNVSQQNDSAAHWQSMKECAEQADRVIKKRETEVADTLLRSQNHYNPVEGRCYVKATYMTDEPTPTVYTALLDAFESRVVAMCTGTADTDAPFAPAYCRLGLPGKEYEYGEDCQKYCKFIDERMNQ